MISLITISCIAAAFTPVITKKLKKQDVALSLAQTSEISDNCGKESGKNFGNATDGYLCKLCTKAYCVQCGLTDCGNGKYIDTKTCSCKKCREDGGLSNCNTCELVNNELKCTQCEPGNRNPATGYYIESEDDTKAPYSTCQKCRSGHYCDDGVWEKRESICDNPPTGQYCDGNTLKFCTNKYDKNCTNCDSTRCTSCNAYYFLNSSNICQACNISGCASCRDSNLCTACAGEVLMDMSNPKHACNLGCASVLPNCKWCSGTTTNYRCTLCNGGYYIDTNGRCAECSTIPNCVFCNGDGKCTTCNSGYYVNSVGGCSLCNIENCAYCSTDGKCITCNQGYHLKEDKLSCVPNNNNFNCSDSNFMQIGNLCVTRRNMGDSAALKLPSDIVVANAEDEYCYSNSTKCCWQGNTAAGCDSQYSNYSGCNRTVCNWKAAKEICEKFNYGGKTWRLATSEEAATWVRHSVGLGQNGLQLCEDYSSKLSNMCVRVGVRCLGSTGDGGTSGCYPNHFWTGTIVKKDDTALKYDVYNGSLFGPSEKTITYAFSVRCVTEME